MKDKKPHENGPCTVSYGSMYGYNGDMIEHPAVILDMSQDPEEILILHKYGPEDKIRPLYEEMQAKYKAFGFDEMAESLTLISFTTITGFPDYDKMVQAKFTTDEICTLINWLNNCIHVKSFTEFMQSDEAAMHARLAQLASFGF